MGSLPATWTSEAAADGFVAVSAGRSAFRAEDLLALVDLLGGLWAGVYEGEAGEGAGVEGGSGDAAVSLSTGMSVKGITPHV